jgi:hypothetical protein
MSAHSRITTAIITLALTAVAVTGCSQTPQSAPSAATVSASPQTAAQPRPPSGDVRACLGAEAVLGHVAAGTARWSPERQPFAGPMASRIRLSSAQLAGQGPQARSARVRAAVAGMARSFRSLSAAMDQRDRGAVDAAMRRTRASYRVLKTTCSLD